MVARPVRVEMAYSVAVFAVSFTPSPYSKPVLRPEVDPDQRSLAASR